MINTFLFDLDGTLLPMEWDAFEKEYFKRLSVKLSDHFQPELLVKYILKSTMKMIQNTGGKRTNKEVFFEDFINTTGKNASILNPIFDDFYANDFESLRSVVKSEGLILKSVELLKEKGYAMVIATNPVFPLEAIKKRIKWAGLDESLFDFITCFENMHYCKPNVGFYREVLEIINKSPDECIMVGNDVEEDLISGKLGIKTFLIKDYMINRSGVEPMADYTGSYSDFYNFVESLPDIKYKQYSML